MPAPSLCPTCAHVEEIVSRRGSKFFLCSRSHDDERWAKYPPQPVVSCSGHESRTRADHTLTVLPGTLAICRLAPDAPMPDWPGGDFVSITRTSDELSIVCAAEAVPEGAKVETGWRALRVEGPLDLGMVGVIAALGRALAEVEVPVFVIATFDTDHLLVREADLGRAMGTLRTAGHRVEALR